jgi:hypothetical protein
MKKRRGLNSEWRRDIIISLARLLDHFSDCDLMIIESLTRALVNVALARTWVDAVEVAGHIVIGDEDPTSGSF